MDSLKLSKRVIGIALSVLFVNAALADSTSDARLQAYKANKLLPDILQIGAMDKQTFDSAALSWTETESLRLKNASLFSEMTKDDWDNFDWSYNSNNQQATAAIEWMFTEYLFNDNLDISTDQLAEYFHLYYESRRNINQSYEAMTLKVPQDIKLSHLTEKLVNTGILRISDYNIETGYYGYSPLHIFTIFVKEQEENVECL